MAEILTSHADDIIFNKESLLEFIRLIRTTKDVNHLQMYSVKEELLNNESDTYYEKVFVKNENYTQSSNANKDKEFSPIELNNHKLEFVIVREYLLWERGSNNSSNSAYHYGHANKNISSGRHKFIKVGSQVSVKPGPQFGQITLTVDEIDFPINLQGFFSPTETTDTWLKISGDLIPNSQTNNLNGTPISNATYYNLGYPQWRWNIYGHDLNLDGKFTIKNKDIDFTSLPSTSGTTAQFLRGDGNWVQTLCGNFYLKDENHTKETSGDNGKISRGMSFRDKNDLTVSSISSYINDNGYTVLRLRAYNNLNGDNVTAHYAQFYLIDKTTNIDDKQTPEGHLNGYFYADYIDSNIGDITAVKGNIVAQKGKILAEANSIWAGTMGDTNGDQRNIGAQSGAGKIYLYSAKAADGVKGLRVCTAAETYKTIISVDQSNVASFIGNADTATKLSSTTTTNCFWRGDNTWSNTLKNNNIVQLKLQNTSKAKGGSTSNLEDHLFLGAIRIGGSDLGDSVKTCLGRLDTYLTKGLAATNTITNTVLYAYENTKDSTEATYVQVLYDKSSNDTKTDYDNYKKRVYINGALKAAKVFKAVFNDYAEYRQTINLAPGHIVIDNDDGSLSCSTQRLQPGAQVISDTFGDAMGFTETCQTPLAVAGRVLVYTYQSRENYHAGMAVCSAPNGTVDIMTREEIREYPDCIIGIVSEIPQYENWGTDNVKVDGRIWIKVK